MLKRLMKKRQREENEEKGGVKFTSPKPESPEDFSQPPAEKEDSEKKGEDYSYDSDDLSEDSGYHS